MQLFGRNSIMVASSNASVKRSEMPSQSLGVLLYTLAISGLSGVSAGPTAREIS
jgi:hypothetical protein